MRHISGFNGMKFILIAAIGLLFTVADKSEAQYFGKNKIQYRDFEWKYVQSRHFDIYYYDLETALAEFVADVAESSYVSLRKDFRHDIQKRIPILVYNGHNDFQQTNVIYSLIDEGVGGFTEIFKDRIVIPFQGNYEEFRHVIHHELTHAVMFQVFYGGGVGSMVTGMARFQMPLWLAEGLAEYESLGWDTESDMFMRDATINGYTPPISQMYGFMVYKGGQSVLKYIAEKYGTQKIGEILAKVRLHKSVDQGIKKSIGLSLEELSERWHKYLRKSYWPDIEDRDEPEDISKRLTDHAEGRHFLNNSPALSPKGDKLVYLSDQSEYMDIYVMSAIDGHNMGRLVKGQRSDLFENLHWLRPGMDWSPEADRIVFAAKSGELDAIYILNVEERRIVDSFQFELDGVFSPAWSPDGKNLVFVGIKNGQSDLYLLDFESRTLQQLTDDIFSDLDPAWSPQSNEIVFVSDRQTYQGQPEGDFSMQNHNYHQYDVYTMDVESGYLSRYTNNEAEEHSPEFSPDGRVIAYVSDLNGIGNIYMLNREDSVSYPITNLLTGVAQISWCRDGSRLAFASFFNGGYDIYLINNPLDIEPGSVVLKNTMFLEQKPVRKPEPAEEKIREPRKPKGPGLDYKQFVFDDRFRKGDMKSEEKREDPFLLSEQYKNSDGDYKVNKYKNRFTVDLISGDAGYSQFFGLQGSSMIVVSDILGNHQFNLYTDLFYNLKNSNFQLAYFYLPKRTDYGISIFHYSYMYYTYYYDGYLFLPSYIRDRNYGLSLYLSRPFNRFKRLDLGLTAFEIARDYGSVDPYYYYYYGYATGFEDLGNLYKRRVMLMNLGYTEDTVIWGSTGPVNGGRSYVNFTYSPPISKTSGLSFWTIKGDWRKYFRIHRDYNFVVRVTGGYSGGKDPQRFLLGGMRNWLNYEYADIPEGLWDDDLFYFSTFETPLRGALYYDMIGSKFFLTNIEFRFPMIRYLILGWPLPLGFQNIRGAIFMDMGSAWEDNNKWQPFASNDAAGGLPKLNDVMAGYGFGARLNIGFLLLRYDVAWATDFASTADKPVHYFTLGAEF